ncbi:hypothetical protein WS48_06810 [Burkholderia sp. RF7-non_BP1]|nr:hypothetical protein WS48_06810 [Burkholderia sp. RF7-non_BP1]KUZ04557.1 hypothetical protein WS49_09360 [Burkholderia sp. RF7-non_BP4]
MGGKPIAAPTTAEAGGRGRHAGGHHARACGNGQPRHRRAQALAPIARCGFSRMASSRACAQR